MNRIDARFEELKRQGRAALIPYVTAGDPTPDHTVDILHALTSAGADMIELGMPFSDPMADGPVIQAACERALSQGADLAGVLASVDGFRREDADTPIILMGYMNPIERFGTQEFLRAAARAGVDGLLIVDLPPEESAEFNRDAAGQGIHQVFLVAPTTSEARLDSVMAQARGFVYYVSFKGITGASHLATGEVSEAVGRIRGHTELPIGVGFGIKSADDARQVAGFADAVVIGSALVDAVFRAGPEHSAEAAHRFLAPIHQAMTPEEATA
ncbi:MAG: tryptophan synthase subunit alpha [Xanthomonadales bacterium]|nr:tryptophan synthase subunit alpha [Xanthomonadales bacterium]